MHKVFVKCTSNLVSTSNLGIQLRIQEVVLVIRLTKWMLVQQSFRRGALARDAGGQLACSHNRAVHIHLHGPAVEHESHRHRTDSFGDIIRDRRGLVQTSQLVDGAYGLFLAPRPLASEHFEYHAAEGPDINLGRVSLSLGPNDLGSHPKDRPLHGIVLVVSVNVVRLLGNAKVGNLTGSVEIQ